MAPSLRRATAALGILLLCAGCSSTQSGAPSQPADARAPSASAPPTPADPAPGVAPEPASVHVTTDSMSTILSDGSIGEVFEYFDPASSAVRGLSDALGVEPETVPKPGDPHHGPYTAYEWDGLVLHDLQWVGEGRPFYNDWSVQVTSPTVNGVQIDTIGGVQIGDSAPALEAAYPEQFERRECCGEPERTEFRLGVVPIEASMDELEEIRTMMDGTDPTPAFAVWLMAPDPAGTVSQIVAPSPNYGV